jgi:hypothetical protein
MILPHLPLVPACPPSASCMAPPVGRPSPRCADARSLWTTGRNGDGSVWVSRTCQQERPGTAASTIHFREAEGTAAEPVLGPGSRMCPIRDAGSLGRRPRRPVRPSQRVLDPGSALLGQALACQPLPFRRKIGDLPALRLAALAVLGSMLVPGPAVATPALTRVHLLRHGTPLFSAGSAIRLRLPHRPAAHTRQTSKTGRRLDDGR